VGKIVGVRGGQDGALEQPMLDQGRVLLEWHSWSRTADLTAATGRDALRHLAQEAEPGRTPNFYGNAAGQLLIFRHLEPGDWVVLPRKNLPVVAIGLVKTGYQHQPAEPYPNSIAVDWLRTDIPRTAFSEEQRFSMGAYMTFFRLEGKGFEELVPKLAKSSPTMTEKIAAKSDSELASEPPTDYEQLTRDEIEARIISRFKGHGLSRLVGTILVAQGFEIRVSPAGPDGGVDVLAGKGSLGLDGPSLAVQVKSGGDEVDIPTYNSLKGAMGSVSARQGLFVSWGGFKPTVVKANQNDWFSIRLWGRKELVDELLAAYEHLDPATRAELPLRRIWISVITEE
jgi:restriction system protein